MRRSGELERAVMDVLWEAAGTALTPKEVLAALPDRHLAHTTVITVLDRLARKGTARREHVGRSWRYTPAASREAYVSSLMMEALGQAGDREAVLVHFAHTVSTPEAQALREALENLAGTQDTEPSDDGGDAEP